MLGSFAANGVELFARQCLNSVYNPQSATKGGATPGFWTTILWKQLMGPHVLNVSLPANSGVRAYAQRDAEQGFTLMLLNLRASATRTDVAGIAPGGCKAKKYTLEAGPERSRGSTVLLNGELLDFADENATALPPITGAAAACDRVSLPPHSVTWLVIATHEKTHTLESDDALLPHLNWTPTWDMAK